MGEPSSACCSLRRMVSPPKKLLLLLGGRTKTILSWAQLLQDLSPTKGNDQPTLPPGPLHNDYGGHGVHSDDVVARQTLPATSTLTKSSSPSTTGLPIRPLGMEPAMLAYQLAGKVTSEGLGQAKVAE